MLDLNNFDILRDSQPYFIYQRVTLNAPLNYMFFPLDYGFWYLLRQIHAKFPMQQAGISYPELDIFAVQKGINKEPQNVPIPLNLFTTPGSSGITFTAPNDMTAGVMKGAKLQNVVYPFRDNMEFQITGQTGAVPSLVDICLIGYYIPVKDFSMWAGANG